MESAWLLGKGAEHLAAFVASLSIGLLIGLERERSPAAKAGLRTFALTAMAGTLAAMLSAYTQSPWIIAAGLFSTSLFIVSAYFGPKAPGEDPGTTTAAALIVCYLLGTLAWYDARPLALMLAIVVSILLYFKPELRGWSQNLARRDIVSIFQFGLLTFVVLPILPDHSFGPYNTLNPYETWLMVVLISGLSLAGYVALRLVGQRYGAPLLGLLGGLVSSTATTLIYARHGRVQGMLRLAVSVILIANMVVILRIGVEALVVSPRALTLLVPVLGVGLFFGLAALLLQGRSAPGQDLPMPEISNPTEIKSAIGFGLLYAIVLLLSAWLSELAGSKGLYAVALVSGLTDVDAITLSSLRLFEDGKLMDHEMATAIVLAFIANLTFKFSLIVGISGSALAKRCAFGFVAMALGLGSGLIWLI